MKTNLKLFSTAVTLLFFLSITIMPASAAVVWSDDFEDGNIDGWTHSFAVFSAVDGVLRCNPPEGYMYQIEHGSTVASGTWSFDMYHEDMATQEVDLIRSESDDVYSLKLENSGVRLISFIDSIANQLDTHEQDIAGWQHIDITRDALGQFHVWINGTHVMQGVDTDLNTSEAFTVGMRDGGGLDNITVSNTVDITPPAETTTETSTTTTTDGTTTPAGIPLELLMIGVAVPVVLVVFVVVWKLRK